MVDVGQYSVGAQEVIAGPPVQYEPAVQSEHCDAAVSGVEAPYLPATHAVHAEAVLLAADQLPSGHSCCVAGVAQ
jgi:hypothetical protein